MALLTNGLSSLSHRVQIFTISKHRRKAKAGGNGGKNDQISCVMQQLNLVAGFVAGTQCVFILAN
jgi:hypothetical protein